jgi:hypothetical protein
MRKICACLSLLFLVAAIPLFAQQTGDQWIRFTAEDKSFSILFPAEPKASDGKGEHLVSYIAIYAIPGERVFLAGRFDYDFVPDTEKELAADRDNFLKELNGKVITSKRLDYERGPGDKLPALEFVGESPDYTFKGLVILEGQRAFMFCAGGKGDLMAPTEKFLNSLKLGGGKH